ncbi:unnamed protein product [Sphagnum troendelagicum]
MKMEKVSVTFSVIMILIMPGCGEYMADQLDLDFWLSTNERYPDFKHKKTGEALWIEDRGNPPWVAAEMAAMAPGRVQLNIFAWNQKLTKDVEDGQLEKAMQLFQQMQHEGMSPENFTFAQVIKACAG